MSRPICAVDIESTGLGWDRQAWEVALIRRDQTGSTETAFFVEVDLAQADPAALDIGCFHQRHPYGQYLVKIRNLDGHEDSVPQPDGIGYLSQDQAVRVIKRMTHQATIVGAQPHFDIQVFERMMMRVGSVPSWHYRLRDVESLTAGRLGRDVGGLAGCVEALALDGEWAAHTALGDARAALAVFEAILPSAGIVAELADQLKAEAEAALRSEVASTAWSQLMSESGITEAELAAAPSELGD